MNNLIKIIAIVGFAAISSSTLAADWTISQTATISNSTLAPDQGDTTAVGTSVQAINGIALETGGDDLVGGSSQLTTLTSSTAFSMTQGPNVDQSSQAVNYIEARELGKTGTAVTQTITSNSTATTLTQEVNGSGSLNVQALNIGKSAGAAGALTNLEQSITEGGTLDLIQNSVATQNNTQAVNYAFGQAIGVDTANNLDQQVTVTGAISFDQQAVGGANTQGGNVIETSATGGIVDAEQTFTASVAIELGQSMSAGDGNVQAVNTANTTANGTGTVGTLTQTFITSSASVTFDSSAGSANNIQAGNLVDTVGSITELTQTFTASASASVDFDQTGAGASNIQAGNMARTNGTGSSIAEITQTFTASGTVNDFTQDTGAANSFQTGNLIHLGTAGLADSTGPHQIFSADGSVDMTQEGGGSNNLQALNATVNDTGSGAVIIVQSATLNGVFTIAQNAVTDSGQFVNYAGEVL